MQADRASCQPVTVAPSPHHVGCVRPGPSSSPGSRIRSTRYLAVASSPGRRNGGGVRLADVETTAHDTSASARSAAYTPWATYAGSGSKRTVSPPCSSGAEPLVDCDHLGQLVELGRRRASAGSTRRRGARTAPWRRGTRARARGRWCGSRRGPMWAPITSGGMNIDAPRWIVWRSRASLQSLVHTRSVRRRISWSMRAPPDEQLSISTSGGGCAARRAGGTARASGRACRPRRRRRCPARGRGSCPT